MSWRFTILGCGASPGVPRIDGDWGACDPTEPRNRRLRCSLLVERSGAGGTTRVLVDTGPDLRQQMLAAGVTGLDAVLYTHAHADHVHGIDDLRQYALVRRKRIPTYADAATAARLMEAFGYCYADTSGGLYPPILEMRGLTPGRVATIDGPGGAIHALVIEQHHGPSRSCGFRFGDDPSADRGGLAYSPDVSGLEPPSIALLQHLDCWIVDALQDAPHISHFSLSDALQWIATLRPAQAILTHMHSRLDYARVAAETPPHVEPAFDGMVLDYDRL